MSRSTTASKGFSRGEPISNADLLLLPCDILVPAALQNQITADNAARVNCKLLAEGANGPTTLAADEILNQRGIFVLPDILGNAGGVIVSYFEWVQDMCRTKALGRWTTSMTVCTQDPSRTHFAERWSARNMITIDLRTAALILKGIQRAAEAKRRGAGLFP